MDDASIKTAKGPTILLGSGHYFDLLDPGNSRFTLRDIARGLGNACRFAGQCDRFYSVAEHTWLASFLVPQPLAFAALMHDAPEALIGDVTRPLKSLLPAYKQIEQDIADVIAERFLLGDLCEHPLVKRADMQMLAAEQQTMMPAHDDTWHCLEGVEVPTIEWKHWLPADAAQNWLNRAATLIGRFTDDVESLLS